MTAGSRTPWRAVVAWVLLVVASTLVWWLLAPQPPVVTDGAQRLSPGSPELAAAQDGTFVVVTGVAGALTGLAVLRARGGPTGARALVALAASGLGAVCTSWLGSALGDLVVGPRRAPGLPADVTERVAEGVVVAPSGLELTADPALAVQPLLAALVVTGVLVAGMLRAPASTGRTPEPAGAERRGTDGRGADGGGVDGGGVDGQDGGGRPSGA